jgi:hypothetical protein
MYKFQVKTHIGSFNVAGTGGLKYSTLTRLERFWRIDLYLIGIFVFPNFITMNIYKLHIIYRIINTTFLSTAATNKIKVAGW